MKKRVTVFYHGQVQGVGFRFTVEGLSRAFDVTGFVRNLPDGTVELVAEGTEPSLKRFVDAINQSRLQQCIVEAKTAWSSAQNNFEDFRIRH